MGNFHPHRPADPAPLLLKISTWFLPVAGAIALAAGLLLPVRFHALEEKVLLTAGKGTPSLPELSASLLNSEHLGAGLRIALLAKSMNLAGGSEAVASAQTIQIGRAHV